MVAIWLKRCAKISSFQRTTIHIIWKITGVYTRSFVDTLFKNILIYTRILWIFLKKSVDKWARRDSGNCSNDMKRRVLERLDLCASFEPYSNFVRGVVASLSLKMYSLFFYIVVLFVWYCLWTNFRIQMLTPNRHT